MTAGPAGGDAATGRTWRYVAIVLALWAFMPEVRRLIDWRIGFEPIPITAVVPIAALLPFVYLAARRWDRVPVSMRIVTWLWCGGFTYAFVVGVIRGDPAAAAYSFSLFVLPLFAGVWAATSERRPGDALAFFATAALVVAALSSAYGLFQYVAPPPWDAYWMTTVGNILGGYPIPFQVRVFGTLNSAGPFANFVALALILAPARRRFGAWSALAIVVCLIALALSLVRSSWLMLLVGIVVYAVLSPWRVRVVRGVVVLAVLATIAAFALPRLIGDQQVDAVLVERFATLGNIEADQSANNRVVQIEGAVRDALEDPLGQGLGTVGTATKLSTVSQSTTVLDSGYLSRLLEMGFPGFVAYLAAIGLVLATVLLVPGSADAQTKNLCALCAAVQVALLFLDLSGESRLGFLGIFCWIPAGLALAARRRARGVPDAALSARIARAIAAVPLEKAT